MTDKKARKTCSSCFGITDEDALICCLKCNVYSCPQCVAAFVTSSDRLFCYGPCVNCLEPLYTSEQEPTIRTALLESGFDKTAQWRERFEPYAHLVEECSQIESEIKRLNVELQNKDSRRRRKYKELLLSNAQRTVEIDEETDKYLKEITRQCPQCSTRVEKADGCDHMWCLVCKHFFDWRTMNLIKERSNPDYFAFRHKHKLIPEAFERDVKPLAEIIQNAYKIDNTINTKVNVIESITKSIIDEHIDFLLHKTTKTVYMSKILILLRSKDNLSKEINALHRASESIANLQLPSKEIYEKLQKEAQTIMADLNSDGRTILRLDGSSTDNEDISIEDIE